MTEVVIYITEADVEAYTQQGWQCWRLLGHHGARTRRHYARMCNFMAVWTP